MVRQLFHELRALWTHPLLYGLASGYAVVSGVFFVALLFTSRMPDLARYYGNIAPTLVVIAPILATRSMAEQRRTGMLELALSWPVGRSTLTLVRYIANVVTMAALASLSWLYVALLARFGPIELGRVAGGWLGLLLLVVAFNGIALAVSAWSTSPALSMFTGFVLLLALWILDFAPGWLGGTAGELLRSLSPATHLADLNAGLVAVRDVGYFLALGSGGLAVAMFAVREPARWRDVRWVRSVPFCLLLLSVLTILIAPASSLRADLTTTQAFTLSERAVDLLRGVRQPIALAAFVNPADVQAMRVQRLVDALRVNGTDIALEIVDPDAAPGRAKAAGVRRYGQAVLAVGERRELLDDLDESAVVSAVVRLARADPLVACFTTGHGERSLDDWRAGGLSGFGETLEGVGFQTRALALGASGGRTALRSCAVVVIAGTEAALLPDEYALLDAYLTAGGRLIAFAGKRAGTVALNRLTAPWGLVFGRGVVEDKSSLAGDPLSIVAFSYPSESPVTERLKDAGLPLLVVGATPVEQALLTEERGWVSRLVESSSASTAQDRGTGDRSGPFTLAALADHSALRRSVQGRHAVERTRVALVGSVEIAANRFLEQLGNRQFVVRLAQWVAREDDDVALVREAVGLGKLPLTEQDQRRLVRWAVVAPMLLPLPLLMKTWRRMRRA